MKFKYLVALAALAILLIPSCGVRSSRNEEEVQNDSIPPYGFWEEDYVKEVSSVLKDDTFNKMMMRLGLGSSDTYQLTKLCADSVFNVRRIRPGFELRSYYTPDSLHTLSYVVYKHSITHYTIFQCKDSLAIWNLHKPVDTERRYANITITSSLWNDMVAAGAPWDLIVEMADVFAWTVDFFALHTDDRFQAVYDINSCEGEYVGLDKIEYCTYDSGGHNVTAIRFDQGDNGNKFWAPDGGSMRKAFLKAPLKFNRVSSKFSYARKHPVTGQVRPHTGVDYAAPTGTPVHALGDGTVISAGWTTTGGGNVVKIRHNSVYTTAYMHLSKINVKAGQRVAQGQTIGLVGSTGRSTGPHLDFRVWKNGTPIDPLKMESPSAEPIKAENLDSLKKVAAAMEAWIAEQPKPEIQ